MALSLRQLARCEAVMEELRAEEELAAVLVTAWPHMDSASRASFMAARAGGEVAAAPKTIERGPALDAFIGAK